MKTAPQLCINDANEHHGANVTPILDALILHAAKERVSLHVPGHHGGRTVYGALSPWLGQAPRLDATELPGLDNLHDASECILASELLAAEYYGAGATYYSVNGSTACIMAAIHACVTIGRRKVVLLGPCHVSVWRGLVYADALPAWIPSRWSEEEHAFQTPDLEAIDALRRVLAGADTGEIACVVVTSPTYQGFIADVARIVEVSHEFGVPVVVDEAHGAHLGLSEDLFAHSVRLGADVVVQSPHKTLPCLTQAAWVHVSGRIVQAGDVREALNFLQTTSPSYLLLAALDTAQAWLRGEGPRLAEEMLERLASYREAPKAADPMRMWLPTGDLAESRRLEEALQEQGVFLEYADASGALAMFGFGQPQNELERFFAVRDHWLQTKSFAEPRAHMDSISHLYKSLAQQDVVLTPREVWRAPGVMVPLSQAVDRPLKRAIAPYPPGVPLLWPGQVVHREHIEGLRALLASGSTVLGLSDGDQIEVCDESG